MRTQRRRNHGVYANPHLPASPPVPEYDVAALGTSVVAAAFQRNQILQ